MDMTNCTHEGFWKRATHYWFYAQEPFRGRVVCVKRNRHGGLNW